MAFRYLQPMSHTVSELLQHFSKFLYYFFDVILSTVILLVAIMEKSYSIFVNVPETRTRFTLYHNSSVSRALPMGGW